MVIKLSNETKCLIKDLETQIDFLIGWSGSGTHWKKDYYVREALIEETLGSEDVPKEIKDKIERIQQMLTLLREGKKPNQEYIKKHDQPRQIPVKEYSQIIGYISLE